MGKRVLWGGGELGVTQLVLLAEARGKGVVAGNNWVAGGGWHVRQDEIGLGRGDWALGGKGTWVLA